MNNKQSLLMMTLLAAAALCGCSRYEWEETQAEPQAPAQAVDDSGFVPGMAYVKVAASQTAELRLAVTGARVATGQLPAAVSRALSAVRAEAVRPLFPIDPRWEQRMRREGLDRWLVVRFDEQLAVRTTVDALQEQDDAFELVEAVPVARTVGAGKPVPVWRGALMAASRQAAGDGSLPFDDPLLPDQWHYHNDGSIPGSVAGADIRLFEAWRQTTGRPEVIVDIHDGGIDVTHEDLRQNLWVNSGEIPGNGIDDDGNGYVDDVHGVNFVYGDGTLLPDDHGTHVAGTVAAVNGNGIGVCGIAGGNGSPATGVRLMSSDMADKKGNMSGNNASAFVYAANNGAVISQNSWGYTNFDGTPSPTTPEAVRVAIDYFVRYAGCDNEGNQLPGSPMKGGMVIFACGNEETSSEAAPANLPTTLAVSSFAYNWKHAYYTNYGSYVDICAPGGDTNLQNGKVTSTVPGNQYAAYQGTSMACPHVSGVAALVVSKFGGPGFTCDDLRRHLMNGVSTEDINAHNPDVEGLLGVGYLDAARALEEQPAAEAEPEVPAGLQVVALAHTGFTLQWTLPEEKPSYYELGLEEQGGDALLTRRYSTASYTAGAPMQMAIGQLTPGCSYLVSLRAVTAGGKKSDVLSLTTDPLPNAAPAVPEGWPAEPFRIARGTERQLELALQDPDGDEVSYQLDGDMKGITVTKTDNGFRLTFRTVYEAGSYSLQLRLTDAYGATATYTLPYQIYKMTAPALTQAIAAQVVGMDSPQQTVTLADHFSWTDEEPVFTAESSDTRVVTAATEGSRLVLKAVQPGTALVTVTARSEGGETQAQVSVRVVKNAADMVYDVYPIPVTRTVHIVLNPSVRQATFSLRSPSGERVWEESRTAGTTDPVRFDWVRILPGVYTLHVESSQGTYKKTIVKQ